MGKWRFEMYQYRQIIIRLRSGESMRSISRAKLADHKTVRKILNIAKQQGWLDRQCEIPKDAVLIKLLDQPKSVTKNKLIIPYQSQIEAWHSQGIQGSTIHAALQRNHGFTGGYDTVLRYLRKLRNNSSKVTTILKFKPAECAQVDFGAGPTLINETTREVINFILEQTFVPIGIYSHQDMDICHGISLESPLKAPAA